MVWTLGFVGTGGVLFRCGGLKELCGVLGVADSSFGVEPEHGGQVEWIGAIGESFLELSVDAQPFEGRGLPRSPIGPGVPMVTVGVAARASPRRLWGGVKSGDSVR